MIRKKSGFTLTEVLITVVVMGVLAGLAIPNYFRTVEQARSNEARANLNVIYTGQKIYLLNNNTFWPVGATDGALSDINANLNIDITTQYYTLSVTAGSGTGASATFTATASRASRGNAGAKQFTINQTGVMTESGSY